jgi:hypothetical protein
MEFISDHALDRIGFGNCCFVRLDVQAEECECEQRFVDTADHDARIFLPVLDVAVILQSRAHIPCEQAPAHGPDESEETVDREVEIRSETYAAVQDYSHS